MHIYCVYHIKKQNNYKLLFLHMSLSKNNIASNNDNEEIDAINKDLIFGISKTLNLVLEENKKLPDYKAIVKQQSKMPFSAAAVPAIPIFDYLIRIQTYSGLDKTTLIVTLIYIDRICEIAQITITYYNIHRLLFAAALIAIKYNEDCYYENSYYAQIAGVTTKELKRIEYTFLDLINFNLFVEDKQYVKYKNYLSQYFTGK